MPLLLLRLPAASKPFLAPLLEPHPLPFYSLSSKLLLSLTAACVLGWALALSKRPLPSHAVYVLVVFGRALSFHVSLRFLETCACHDKQ